MCDDAVSFHSTNGLLDGNSYLGDGFVECFLYFFHRLSTGLSLFERNSYLSGLVVFFQTLVAQIHPEGLLFKPALSGVKLLLEDGIVVLVPPSGFAKIQDALRGIAYNGILYTVAFFLPL